MNDGRDCVNEPPSSSEQKTTRDLTDEDFRRKNQMKKIASMILAIVFMISMASVASAGTKITSGYSSGGTVGSTECTGELHYYNSSNPGEDYAHAETAAIKAGTKTAKITIYYGNTSTTKNATGNGYADAITAKAYAGDGYQAASATSTHTYSSGEYGTWKRTQTRGL